MAGEAPSPIETPEITEQTILNDVLGLVEKAFGANSDVLGMDLSQLQAQYDIDAEQGKILLNEKFRGSSPGRSTELWKTYNERNPESEEAKLYNRLHALNKLIKTKKNL